VPKNLASLTVQVVVPDPAARYEVRVQGPSIAAMFSDLTVRTASGMSYVQFSMPRSRLQSQTYEFRVYRMAPGAEQLLQSYGVRISAP